MIHLIVAQREEPILRRDGGKSFAETTSDKKKEREKERVSIRNISYFFLFSRFDSSFIDLTSRWLRMRFASCSCIVCDRINLHSNLGPPPPGSLFCLLSPFIFRLPLSLSLLPVVFVHLFLLLWYVPFSLYIYVCMYLFLFYAFSSLLFAPRAFGHPRTLPPISGGSLLNLARIVFKLVRAFASFLHPRVALFPVVLPVVSCRLLKGPLTDSCYLIFYIFCIYL